MKKPLHISFEDDLKKDLKNPRFKAMYEKELQKADIAIAIAFMRQKNRLTQSQMAKKLKVSQAAVARIEAGEQNLTLETMMKIAKVFKKKLVVKFV